MLGSNTNDIVVTVIITGAAAVLPYCYQTALYSVAPFKATQPRLQDSEGVHPNAHSAKLRKSKKATSQGSSYHSPALFLGVSTARTSRNENLTMPITLSMQRTHPWTSKFSQSIP